MACGGQWVIVLVENVSVVWRSLLPARLADEVSQKEVTPSLAPLIPTTTCMRGCERRKAEGVTWTEISCVCVDCFSSSFFIWSLILLEGDTH